MKNLAIVLLFACLSDGALAADEATPSPTPVYLKRAARPGSLRRQGQIERRRDHQARSESSTRAGSQAIANRRTNATAQAEARAAARAREQAQRQVAAQARREAANATLRATSGLMSRMGFSEQEVAAQKAREQSARQEVKGTTNATPPAKSAAEQKPTSASPVLDPDFH